MKALKMFVRGGDESLREAHVRLRKLISATHSVTEQQEVHHWYSILDKELKTLVRNEALQLDVLPTLRFVFETLEQIKINLFKKRLPWISSNMRKSLSRRLKQLKLACLFMLRILTLRILSKVKQGI